VIEFVGVVIPAHDEEELLPACLLALAEAVRSLDGVAVRVIVVADGCRDRTASIAREFGATVVEVAAHNVGEARVAGVREALRLGGDVDPGRVWIATTDADTIVAADWLRRQLLLAGSGWEAVVGTVTVTDWSGRAAQVRHRFEEGYRSWAGTHPHVHGANLGFSGRAYLAVGGFAALRTAEDHALVEAFEAAGRRVLRTNSVTVVTSARESSTPGGFGAFLTSLTGAGPSLDDSDDAVSC
jgi:glycosyltransferase involved in cell wall biosynthesis